VRLPTQGMMYSFVENMDFSEESVILDVWTKFMRVWVLYFNLAQKYLCKVLRGD
jgi:hypothetical protein